MDGTIKSFASGALVSPLVLNEAIDSAKVLLSKVFHPSANSHCQIASPVYCEGKSREMILAGTTVEKMTDIYSPPRRNLIYEPATIHDLP
jgi:hypothetical protein